MRLEDDQLTGTATGVGAFVATVPTRDGTATALLDRLVDRGVPIVVDRQPGKQTIRLLTSTLLPLLVLAALFGLLFAGPAGTAGVRGFGRLGGSRAVPPSDTFDDVAGADRAVAELRDVVDHLRDPARYDRLGALPPRGVLLVGPPGTGKTLIARATAGEAGVPFFSVAGAAFVESLVGVGAARVRDLFEQVRASAPAIVFIDEIDAFGRRRGQGDGGSAEEREQTLNQLLVELDGFTAATGIVVIAATNRPDVLDPALLRPGRFDRHVLVDLPDRAGRARILALHAARRPLDADVDLDQVARRTAGFSGADLAGVLNEAALLAVRAGRAALTAADLSEGIDRVLVGATTPRTAADPQARHLAAARVAARAVVAVVDGRECDRISLHATGPAGIGPEERTASRSRYLAGLRLPAAGIAAELELHGEASTQCEADIEALTTAADIAVRRYGLGPRTGPVRLVGPGGDHLGSLPEDVVLSEQARQRVEEEVRALVDDAIAEAREVLRVHRRTWSELTEAVADRESLEGAALAELLAPVRAPVATPGR
ncbi:hypothetical protein GCM10022215_11800 [Nocardioides fonticola]|uniref:AAA+ ATPase domain-containing protein n=1 Tax=Nocardioides fonticola TaxID=450363 RepID=A0ABP7XF67_9ACTN